MALPYPQTVVMPAGDSRTLRFKRPRDHLTGELINPSDFDAIDFGAAVEGEDTAKLTKALGSGVSVEASTGDVLVILTATDTATTLGPGRYTLQARLSRDGGVTRYTLLPIHVLVLTPSPL